MHDLQEKLVSPSILALSNAREKYRLDTDACNVHAGCVLLQEQTDRTAKPVGYWSGSLIEAKQAYDITQREGLVNVWSS